MNPAHAKRSLRQQTRRAAVQRHGLSSQDASLADHRGDQGADLAATTQEDIGCNRLTALR